MGTGKRFFNLLILLSYLVSQVSLANVVVIMQNGKGYTKDSAGNLIPIPTAQAVEDEAPAAESRIIFKDGKAFTRMPDGSLAPVQKAIPIEDDAPIPSTPNDFPKKSFSTPSNLEIDLSKVELPKGLKDAIQNAPLEDIGYETQEDQAFAESMPWLGVGAAVVAVGAMLARRIYYLRTHPGAIGNEAIQAEIKRYDGRLEKIARLKEKLGIETRFVGNKVVLSLKKTRDKIKQGIPLISRENPALSVSQIESELNSIALQWEKNHRELDRLEEKLNAEQLRIRAETFAHLDSEYARLRAEEKQLLAEKAKDKVDATIRKAYENAKTEHRSAELEQRKTSNDFDDFDRQIRHIIEAVRSNSIPRGKLAQHPFVQERFSLFEQLQTENAHYRKLTYERMSRGSSPKLEAQIADSEKKQTELRKILEEGIYKAAEAPLLEKSRTSKESTDKLRFAEEKLKQTQAAFDLAAKNISESDKQRIAELRSEREELKKHAAYLASQNPYMIDRGNEGTIDNLLDPTKAHSDTLNEINRLRADIFHARIVQNEDTLRQKAESLQRLADLEVTNNLSLYDRRILRLDRQFYGSRFEQITETIPIEGYNFWIKHLMEHTRKELGFAKESEIVRDPTGKVLKSVQINTTEVFEEPKIFMKLLAGEDQGLGEENARKARAIVAKTLDDLEIEVGGDKPLSSNTEKPWYHGLSKKDVELTDFYYIMRDIGGMARAGQSVDTTRDLARAKEKKADELAERRIMKRNDHSLADANRSLTQISDRTHTLLTGPTSRTLNRARSPSGVGSACASKLRQSLALF